MNKKIVRVGLAVYVLRADKVLLLLRKGDHAAGFWGTPGGHLEFGETPQECAYREVAEEAGIKIKNVRCGCITNDIFSDTEKHYVTFHMVAEYVSGEAQVLEPEKCAQWQWFSWEELPDPLMLPIVHAREQGFNPFRFK